MDTLEVLEVDQWTSTDNLTAFTWADLKAKGHDAISGGDSEAARQIFGGRFHFRTVSVADRPRRGNVWFYEIDGKPELYATNYDSSD